MRRKLKTFLTTLFAAVGLSSVILGFGAALMPIDAKAETQAVTSNSIIKTSELGDIDVSSLKMKDGAAVRLKDLNNPNETKSRNGLRFTALFNKKIYNMLEELDDYSEEISVGYGMLIVPYDYVTGYAPVTVENIFGETPKYYIDGVTKAQDGLKKIGGWYHLDLPEEDGDTREKEVYCSIINIAESQLTRQWVGVAYIEYIENDVAQYYMTEVEASNARSMVYVAQKAIQDTSSKAPNDTQKDWLEKYYTTYSDATVTIPTKEYTYTVNHIKVDPLGNETIEKSTVSETKTALYSEDEGNYTANTVSVNAAESYEYYTLDNVRSVTEDIVYANHMTALNYYYNQDHCDISFTGEKCTMTIEGKEGAHLSYVALDGATSFSFSIVPDVGYSSGTVTVTVDGTSVTAVDGKYTVSLENRAKDSTIAIVATIKAGTVSDQVFESTNYDSTGEQSQSGLGVIAGWLGFGDLTVDDEAGTITSTGGSLELSGDFIKNALAEGYTHMVCDVAVSGGIGTFTKLEMVNGGSTVFYQKTGTATSRTDRIDLTEFDNGDGTCSSLMFRAYRKLFTEAVSSSATVQLSNIRMYKSEETVGWKKYQKTTDESGNEVNTPITNAYAAYEDGNLVIETMVANTYFERDNSTLEYDLSVGVSMSFAFKYLTAGDNDSPFFYHFTNTDMAVEHKNPSTCHIDDNGFSHMCILPETVQAAAEAAKTKDVKFHFGLESPGTAMLILANSGASVHNALVNGVDTVVADTWGYPYGHGIYNEFLQVNDAATAKAGVEFNINMHKNHTIHLEVTADFNFEGFWYGNNEWTGYKAGMYQFTDVDTIVVDGVTTYWTEIVYTHNYTDKGFNIHWREDIEGADGSNRVGTMQLHYTLTSDATMEYYSFVPDKHTAGIETSEEMHDGIKVEVLTGVEGTMFTMPVFDTQNEKTITLTVSAEWDFKTLKYGAGDLEQGLQNFAPAYDSEKNEYKQTVSVTAKFESGFKIYYTTDALPENVVKATIRVSVYVDNFEASTEVEGIEVKATEVLQADGWTKYYAENVQANTLFNFPSMPADESISIKLSTNIPLNEKDGVLSYGTPIDSEGNGQMIPLLTTQVTTSQNATTNAYSYTASFTYCNPDYKGFQIALNYTGSAFPSGAYMQIQYCFTDFKIKNTDNVLYTDVEEIEITEGEEENKVTKQQATLYSASTEARFWLDTAGYAEIQGTITSSVALTEGILLYGHGWDTAGVVAVNPANVTMTDGVWSYSFTYHESLENGFCIYYTTNNSSSFAGEVVVTYQLYTIEEIVARESNWSVEEGGTSLTFKQNGHVEYSSSMKEDGTGYELYIDKSVFEIAYKNGYSIIGITFASDDTLTAYILNGNGAAVSLEKDSVVEHTLFNVTIEDLCKKDEKGQVTGFTDMILRFDYLEVKTENGSEGEDTTVAVTLERIAFIKL